MTRKTRSTHQRRKRGPSKWERNANKIKYYKLRNNTLEGKRQSGNSKYFDGFNFGSTTKYTLIPRSKPKSLKMTPRKPIRITASYLVWTILWIIVPVTIIYVSNLPPVTMKEPFSVVVSTGQYATFEVTMQTGEEDPVLNYYKYEVISVEENENTNSILVSFYIYNSTTLDFINSTPRLQKLNLTNTIADIQMGSMMMGGGRQQGSGSFPGGTTPPSGFEPPEGFQPPEGTQAPTGFSAGGFRGGTGISQILVPQEFDFTSFEDDLNSQYSGMSSRFSSMGSGSSSTSTMTVTITTSTKKMETTMHTGTVLTMDQYSEYSLKGLLIKQSSYSVRSDFGSGESTETWTTTKLVANSTTVFY